MNTTTTDVMDPFVAVFNCHVNNAKDKADMAFIKRFGQNVFDREIAPLHVAGIMSIFDKAPTKHTGWYVEAIHIFANEHKDEL